MTTQGFDRLAANCVGIGDTVLYRLSAADVQRITTARGEPGTSWKGNAHTTGQVVPLVVVWVVTPPDDAVRVNGQAVLDGADSLWVTSAREGSEPGMWAHRPAAGARQAPARAATPAAS